MANPFTLPGAIQGPWNQGPVNTNFAPWSIPNAPTQAPVSFNLGGTAIPPASPPPPPAATPPSIQPTGEPTRDRNAVQQALGLSPGLIQALMSLPQQGPLQAGSGGGEGLGTNPGGVPGLAGTGIAKDIADSVLGAIMGGVFGPAGSAMAMIGQMAAANPNSIAGRIGGLLGFGSPLGGMMNTNADINPAAMGFSGLAPGDLSAAITAGSQFGIMGGPTGGWGGGGGTTGIGLGGAGDVGSTGGGTGNAGIGVGAY